ncbi:hypothetical protein [Dactylosporangium sp. NPDC051484]|uniref:hypothetical protein n=1 Tax=Dactylosporangium sp. NPDC051484 TaxID=3154942 RepID=UPI00344DD0DF
MPNEPKRRPRYGLTRAQIAAATERRTAGDWASACAVAGIEAALDPRAIAREHGAEVAAAVDDDLHHLVPDLLRWHVLRLQHHPARDDWRYRSAVSETRDVISLSLHGDRALYLAPSHASGRRSWRTASSAGPARFTLRFGVPPAPHHAMSLAGLRELWDARRTAGLLARCGGYTRLPGFAPDGARREGAGPEAMTERILRHFREDRPERGWREAGFDLDLDLDLDGSADGWHDAIAHRDALAAPGLPAAAWRATVRDGLSAAWVPAGRNRVLWFDRLDPGRLDPSRAGRPRLRVVEALWLRREPAAAVALTELFWPEDLRDLVHGRIAPHELHPLVATALFPALPGAGSAGPPDMRPPGPVRVRCGAGWHRTEFRDGVLSTPHPTGYADREAAMLALGGPPPAGCAGAYTAWRGGPSRLPRSLRETRRELMSRVAAGESDTLESMLDAGLDPHCRDGDGRTLLHLLPCLVPDESRLRLLPRLLAAGLDPRARDHFGLTPARLAELGGAAPELIDALRAAR